MTRNIPTDFEFNRRTVLKGTIAASTVGFTTAGVGVTAAETDASSGSGGSANTETLTLSSQPGHTVYGPSYTYRGVGDPSWGSAKSAVAAWVHPEWPDIPGATWISTSRLVEDNTIDSWRWFHREFTIPSNAFDIQATVTATADNAEAVYLNGQLVGSNGAVQGPPPYNEAWENVKSYEIAPRPGRNNLDFIVRNYNPQKAPDDPKDNPTGLIYKVDVTYKVALTVDIDINPGNDPNPINPDSNGNIPVAILHTDEFNPVNRVNVSSLRFGDPDDVDNGGGATPVHDGHVEDVDGDGDDDLVLHFPTQDAGFDGDENEGKLVGETNDGTPLFGTDSVKLVGGVKGGGP